MKLTVGGLKGYSVGRVRWRVNVPACSKERWWISELTRAK